MVKKEVLVFSIVLSLLLISLKVLESAFYLQAFDLELYISVVALNFLIFGLWFGNMGRPSKEIKSSSPELIESKKKALQISDREYDVILGIADGLSNREIADQLHLSEHTIKSHLSNVFSKLNVRRRTELIKIAKAEGLIDQ